jgi:NADP-dependent 3-hydroxy acid dehydrogenase YdfG
LQPEDIARLVGFIVSQPAHVHVNDVVIRSTRQEYP